MKNRDLEMWGLMAMRIVGSARDNTIKKVWRLVEDAFYYHYSKKC